MRCRTQHPAAAASAAAPAAAFLRFHFAVDSGLCTADAAGSVGNDVVGGGAQRQPGRSDFRPLDRSPFNGGLTGGFWVVQGRLNKFRFSPKNGFKDISFAIADWVSKRSKDDVDSSKLTNGNGEVLLKDGAALNFISTAVDVESMAYPFWYSVCYSHPDSKKSGRTWVTEIGVYQQSENDCISLSLLLRADDISARITTPVQVSRPKLVDQLLKSCNPVGWTPGLKVRSLEEKNAKAFLNDVEREERDYPIVVISSDKARRYPVSPERVRSTLAGLADVVSIPSSEDTFSIQDAVAVKVNVVVR